jgi:AcrR family transcriptional regulator
MCEYCWMQTTEPGMRERKKLHTRFTIERAAVDLVLENGFDGTTVEAIAERADVTPRTFFNHFADKADAVLGIAREQDVAADVDVSSIDADTAFGYGVAIVRAGVSQLDDSAVAVDKRRREVFARNPALLAREMEKIVLIESSITRHLDRYLAARGVPAGIDREDLALAVTVTVTAAARLAFIRWSREATSARELVSFFDSAVATITTTLTDGKTA